MDIKSLMAELESEVDHHELNVRRCLDLIVRILKEKQNMARWDKEQLHETFRSMLHDRHESDILSALAEVLDIQENSNTGDPVAIKIHELARDIKANHDR